MFSTGSMFLCALNEIRSKNLPFENRPNLRVLAPANPSRTIVKLPSCLLAILKNTADCGIIFLDPHSVP